jgi:hypothetical protein
MVTRTMKTREVESLSRATVPRGPADDHQALRNKKEQISHRRVTGMTRTVACGLITGAALLGVVPVAMADAQVSTISSDRHAAPQAEVSMLAVLLTVGGAVAAAGSGMVLVLSRRRAVSSVTGSPIEGHVASE